MDETLYPSKCTILEPVVQNTVTEEPPKKLEPVLEEKAVTEELLSILEPVVQNTVTEELQHRLEPVLEEKAVTEELLSILEPVVQNTVTEEPPKKLEPVLEEKAVTEELLSILEPVVQNTVTEELLSKLRLQCKDIGVKKTTIAVIIKYVIEAVEDTPVKGAAQKEYALRLLRALIDELSQGEDKEYLLNAIDSGSIGDIIELIVSASKGEININKIIKTTSTMLPYCMALIGKCLNKPKK